MFKNQITIDKELTFTGIGLHSGDPVKIKLIPAETDTGINFIYKKEKIRASWKNAQVSQLCTRINYKFIYFYY